LIYGMGAVYFVQCHWDNFKLKFSKNNTLEKQLCELKRTTK